MVYLIVDKALHAYFVHKHELKIKCISLYMASIFHLYTSISLFWKAVLHVDIHTTKVKKRKEEEIMPSNISM